MDQNGNKINAPGFGDSGLGLTLAPNRASRSSVEICDPRRGAQVAARGLPDYQIRDPWNTSSNMVENRNRLRHCTNFHASDKHQQPMTSSHGHVTVSAQHNNIAAYKAANPYIDNLTTTNSSTNDFRRDHQRQHGTSSLTLPSPYSSFCNMNPFSQMQRIGNGMPLLQPPGPVNAYQHQPVMRPGDGCFNQNYRYQYGQPHPSTIADYAPLGAQVQAGYSKEKFQIQADEVLENPRKMQLLNSSAGNMEFDSFQSKPNITPKTDSSIIELQLQRNTSQASSQSSESQKRPSKPTPPVIMIGKRRGGRVLPTGVIKRLKSADPSNARKVDATTVTSKPDCDVKSPAWKRYMAEVEQYRNQLCSEEKQNHPLVK
ncbi:unnamed protein product [Orchesella dallaii]|uniref:Uncharacterized protein n=1 Tax=Orchesella dallaii TaxID=48710 RepID=A0ABP1PJS4_9HEXA